MRKERVLPARRHWRSPGAVYTWCPCMREPTHTSPSNVSIHRTESIPARLREMSTGDPSLTSLFAAHLSDEKTSIA